MPKNTTAILRGQYTGESYTQAVHWLGRNGLFQGLVPPASDPQQIRLEAAALLALSRPAPTQLPASDAVGSLYGLAGTTPGPDELLLLPAAGCHGQVLAHLLPSLTAEGTVAGVPGLRVFIDRASPYLWLRRLREHAALDVMPSRRASAPAARQDLAAARRAVEQAGLTPLWDLGHQHPAEVAAWRVLTARLHGDEARWSCALRRVGLFRNGAPAWGQHPPTEQELRGPRPDKLTPRPVVPDTGQQVRGVVAVTAGDGKGGRGCTTMVLALAGALARSGVRVAVLAEGDDPSGVFSVLRVQPPLLGTWGQVPGGGIGQPIMLGSLTRESAEAQITAARRAFDVVVVDAGHGLQHRPAASSADLAVLLDEYRPELWGHMEQVDLRPEEIRFFAWMNDRATDYFHRAATVTTARQRLLNLLNVEFAWDWAYFVTEGEGDEALEVDDLPYDRSDPEDVESWWSEAWEDSTRVSEDLQQNFPDPADPRGRDRRGAFAEFLAEEGLRRHGALWTAVVQEWLSRPLAQIHTELASRGDRSLAGLMEEVADDAVARWGSGLWQDKVDVWAAARQAGDDLVSGWSDLIEQRHVPQPAEDIAAVLAHAVRVRPGTSCLLALSGPDWALPHHRTVEVRNALPDGFVDLTLWPRRKELGQLFDTPELLLSHRSGPAAAVANRLAQVVVRQLRLAAPTR
ncbi:hypothetical protein [Kitasatospora aureofaciens]|uniref:hypothetical protein n=1 Tax=Kitasatospora aureofaciens TaxID=1894 RepID=UPI000B1D7919|nr:hypothetical protein [Kitasatospora aureofaciens]